MDLHALEEESERGIMDGPGDGEDDNEAGESIPSSRRQVPSLVFLEYSTQIANYNLAHVGRLVPGNLWVHRKYIVSYSLGPTIYRT